MPQTAQASIPSVSLLPAACRGSAVVFSHVAAVASVVSIAIDDRHTTTVYAIYDPTIYSLKFFAFCSPHKLTLIIQFYIHQYTLSAETKQDSYNPFSVSLLLRITLTGC